MAVLVNIPRKGWGDLQECDEGSRPRIRKQKGRENGRWLKVLTLNILAVFWEVAGLRALRSRADGMLNA